MVIWLILAGSIMAFISVIHFIVNLLGLPDRLQFQLPLQLDVFITLNSHQWNARPLSMKCKAPLHTTKFSPMKCNSHQWDVFIPLNSHQWNARPLSILVHQSFSSIILSALFPFLLAAMRPLGKSCKLQRQDDIFNLQTENAQGPRSLGHWTLLGGEWPN